MNLHVLEGRNFSGRTERLRRWVGLSDSSNTEAASRRNAYIGPDGVSALSGIVPTVAAEIELMARDSGTSRASTKVMEELGFGYCLAQNPFSLSGGEQVVVAIVAAAAGKPERLAIDCALEQLSDDVRTRVLQYLASLDGDLAIADNRLDEWFDGQTEKLQAETDAPCLCTNDGLEAKAESAKIELVDLGYSYVKGRPIFSGLNIALEPGMRYLLRGPNGSGKTTLSKILCGLLKPTAGEIRVNGRRVEPWRTPGRFVAYNFQNPDYQLFANRVADQFGSMHGISDGLIQYFGLHGLLDEHPLDLPYVLKKRIAIASAFARNTAHVILDEPTIGQDAAFVSALTAPRFQPAYVTISHSRCFTSLPTISLQVGR